MLKISGKQMQGLTQHAEQAFHVRVLDFVRQHLPEYGQLADDSALAIIGALVRRARNYGLETEKQAAVFVLAAHFLGGDFDMTNPDAAARLNDDSLSPKWKANWLEAFAISFESQWQEQTS